jgi:hypothetical protein
MVVDLYTLKAIGTDEFEDVKPARKVEQPNTPVPQGQVRNHQ